MNVKFNTIYNQEYFKNFENRTSGLWWSSASRKPLESNLGQPTEEVLEIDLNRKRSINYISFEILKKPVNIKIEYDAIGLDDLESYPFENRWVEVTPAMDMQFDEYVNYEANLNPWKQCEFYFADAEGRTIFARTIRITFSRRDDVWPVDRQEPFPWSIDVNNIRVMRIALDVNQMRGTIIEINNQNEEIDTFSNGIGELRQRFVLPENYRRYASQTTDLTNIDGFTTTDIYPRMLGFGIYLKPESITGSPEINWQLYEITYGENLIASGKKNFSTSVFLSESSEIPSEQKARWVDIFFDQPIESNSSSKYELRFFSTNSDLLKTFYSYDAEDSEYSNLIYKQGTNLSRQSKRALTYRIFGDVGSSGTDILGNEYRESLRINKARNAVDGKSYTMWVSNPNPSPDGVESLYLDVRKNSEGSAIESIIDGLEINTGSPGVMMNVYYTTQKTEGAAPSKIEDWENMMWTPIRESYILNKKEKITFPTIRANFICLEFYNLQPYPFNFPNFPYLPNVEYSEFPDWVKTQSPSYQTTSFTNSGVQTISVPFYDIFNRVKAEPAQTSASLPATAEDVQTQKGYGSVSQQTASGVIPFGNSWTNPPINNVDSSGILGQELIRRFTQNLSSDIQAEGAVISGEIQSRSVSNINNRPNYTRSATKAMMFNRVCAHNYDKYRGRFNKKAYIVSVSELRFFRKDFSTRADDPIIRDILSDHSVTDSPLIESSNWIQQNESRISVNEKLYVSYNIGNTEYVDEPVLLDMPNSKIASAASVALQRGGQIATNVRVHTGIGEKGQRYIRDLDYILIYDTQTNGNQIARNPLHFKLVVRQPQNPTDRHMVSGTSVVTDQESMRHALRSVSISTNASVTADLFVPLEGHVNSRSYIYVTLGQK